MFSSSRPYGYETICDNFVSEGVIFVTLNYRLGFLGSSFLLLSENTMVCVGVQKSSTTTI